MHKAWEDLTRVEQLQSEYSDCYKSVHGVRPRFMSDEQWNSEEWLNNALTDLGDEFIRVAAAEAEREKVYIANFESRVTDAIELGAKDRETAIRWIADAADVDGDMEFLCFKLGLPYNYFKAA